MGKMVLDSNAWDAARRRQKPATPAAETLDILCERLQQDHVEARHAGNGVIWQLDLAGVYCDECLNSGYHFNLYPLDGFLRVIDGPDPDADFYEVSFLPD